MIWYSYWVRAKGYGHAAAASPRGEPQPAEAGLTEAEELRLRGWLRQMTLDNTVAVGGTVLVTVAFLVLGTEMLRPVGILPAEDEVAGVLGRLLGDVWGPIGFWFMVFAVLVGFWGTVLSDQDGFARMFADGSRLLAPGTSFPPRWTDERRLRRMFLVALLTAAPLLLYAWLGEPVGLLKIAGAVEAAHIPVVAALTLWLNRRALPERLRPRAVATGLTITAAAFFTAFAGFFIAARWG